MAFTKITSDGIGDNAITSSKIASGAVTVADIPDGEITAAKLANGSITAAKIPDGEITAAKLGSTVISDAISPFYSKGSPTFTADYSIDNPNAYGTAEYDYFGTATAISGNLAVIGARNEDDAGGLASGKIYTYNLSTNTLLQTISNPNAYGTSADDYFGFSVTISGNYVAASATGEDESGLTSVSKVYIFNATTGSLLYTLNNPNPYGTAANDRFGESLASSGNYLFVTASAEELDASGTNTDSGKVYVYNITTGTLLYTIDNPNAYNTSLADYFGWVISAYGSYLAVCAFYEDDASGSASGKVYVFSIGDSSATLLYTLNNPNPAGTSANDGFGRALATSSTRLAVGSRESSGAYTASGYAYVYDIANGTLLYSIANPNAYDTPSNDQFGESMGISGDLLVVGARGETDPTSSSYVGKAYVFNLANGALLQTIDDPNKYAYTHSDTFAGTISASGSHVLISAPSEHNINSGGVSGSGVVYKYTSSTPITLTASNFVSNGTGAITLPIGTTAQRPVSPTNGMTRFNTTTGYPEWYSAAMGAWINYSDLVYSIDYLVVAGGGGGGGAENTNGYGGGAGGGGAGGYLASSTTVTSLTSYSITVGGGGGGGSNSGNPSTATAGGNGSNSTFATITAIGGGGGGRDEAGGGNPGSGGSGGGAGGDSSGIAGGSGTAGQGYAGTTQQARRSGGGGGGASAAATSRLGANGLNWQSLGTYYSGGGGGGAGDADTSTAAGGLGGGGTGASTPGNSSSNAGSGGETAGGTNTGGGGGGAAAGRSSGGQSGGSGIVIIRYAGSQKGSGGSVTSSGGYTYHTFTTSGTFTA